MRQRNAAGTGELHRQRCVVAPTLSGDGDIERGTRRREGLIDSLHQSELQVRDSRNFLQTTLNSIGDAVIATDAEGRITFGNPAQAILHQTEADLVGKHLDDVFRLVDERTRATVQSPVAKVLKGGSIAGLANNKVLIRPDGSEIPIDDSAAPIRGPDGSLRGTVLVFRDITERRRAEQELLRANEDLNQFAFAVSLCG